MMLTRLREIVEKVAAALGLNEALNVLVGETCQAMNTEVCSIYLADHERQCYYLMATRGLKKPLGALVTLNFNEGIVGLVGGLVKPVNLADAPTHPSFKYVTQLNEDNYRAFLGAPVVYHRQLLGVLVVQQREPRQFDEAEESFLVTLAMQLAGVLSQNNKSRLLGHIHHRRLPAIAVSPGIAVGEGWMDLNQPSLEQIYQASTLNSASEQERLMNALEEAAKEFRRFSKRFTSHSQKDSAAIFDLYLHLLNDVRLKGELMAKIALGSVAEWAVKQVIEHFAEQFSSLQDPYMRERASDLRALGQRLLFHLNDQSQRRHLWPAQFILVADELTASMLAEIPQERLIGVVVRDGAANSHAAILVRAMGIPTVMGVDIQPALLHRRCLIVDGYCGEVLIEPDAVVLQEYQCLVNEETTLSQMAEEEAGKQARLKSGERIQVMLNTGLSVEHEQWLDSRVDGVGLYRTEIPFMLHNGFPSEEEQLVQYQKMLQINPAKPVTLRSLDIGADKQLPYMPISEENPHLGWRGIRVMLDQPDIFLTQVRAMLRANATTGNLNILLPMITSITEVDEAKRLIALANKEVGAMIGYPLPKPPIGVMLEVPALVFLLPDLAPKVDFVSIGTNDLTQYLLAVDRNNTRVASLYNSLHPSVLRVLYQILTETTQLNLPVSVCGEMAGDPIGALLLVGMGFRHLSMSGHSVARIKYLLRHIEQREAFTLVQQALNSQATEEVRHHTATFLEQRGLGGLIRGGL